MQDEASAIIGSEQEGGWIKKIYHVDRSLLGCSRCTGIGTFFNWRHCRDGGCTVLVSVDYFRMFWFFTGLYLR